MGTAGKSQAWLSQGQLLVAVHLPKSAKSAKCSVRADQSVGLASGPTDNQPQCVASSGRNRR